MLLSFTEYTHDDTCQLGIELQIIQVNSTQHNTYRITYLNVHAYIRTYKYTCTHVCSLIHIQTHARTRTHTHNTYTVCTYSCACVFINVTIIHACVFINTHKRPPTSALVIRKYVYGSGMHTLKDHNNLHTQQQHH